MIYKDLGAMWVPDEEILGIKFVDHKYFSQEMFLGKPYMVFAYDDKENFYGCGADGKVYVLDKNAQLARYASDCISDFARQLKVFRDLPVLPENAKKKDIEQREVDFRIEVNKIDPEAFHGDDRFWAMVVKHVETGEI